MQHEIREKESDGEEQEFEKNPVRAPYVSLALSRRLITTLSWCVAGMVLVTVILAIGFTTSINRKPWILTNSADGYEEMGVGRASISRGDVERFLNFVIPNIYGSLNGSAPGLNEIRGLVNESILGQQEKELEGSQSDLKDNGVSQFAIVTGINPETMVINRKKNFVYAEALGTIVLTQARRSEKTEVQWRVLIYIVEPTDALTSSTPAGQMRGNRLGLYLQQIAEQPPGTVNEDSPKPTTDDLQEREAERKTNGEKGN